jgi:hypothetical protein
MSTEITPANPNPTPANHPELAALRTQVFILLVALFVVSGTLTVYLYSQARSAGKDLEAIRPQAQQVIGGLRQNERLIQDFVNALVAYGQTHPDFVPVLAKYNIAPVKGVPPGASPMTAPAPAKK